jgi:hypothetical protein
MQTTPRPRRSLSGWLFLLLIVLAIWAVQSGRVVIPDDWNPWAPLDIDAEPNLLTRHKLARASSDPDACRAALAKPALVASPLPDRITGPGCGFDNAFRIERTSVDVGAAFSLSCRAALSLVLWERHVLQQQAMMHLGSPVRRIEHLGSYACRNVYGQDGRRRSQHATADALDIAGFVLDDGRRIRILRDWRSADADDVDSATVDDMQARARFLRALRDGACDWFDAVLGPDYNAAHADHFHFDRGRARLCR